MLVNDETFAHDGDDGNSDDFVRKNEKRMFEISKNTMKYEMMKRMFDLDFDDVVKVIMMKNWKRNILNDVDENEEMVIDDDDDTAMLLIDNGGDDDGEHSVYWDNGNDESDDDDSSNHFFDRNWTENHDDRIDDDQVKIFVDVHLLLMELMNHYWIFYHYGNFHALKIPRMCF